MTATDRLLDIAEQLDQLHHQLCDEAERLIPVSSPVKTADNPIALPTHGELLDIIRKGGFYSDTASEVLDLIASRVPAWQPVEPGTVIKAGTRYRVETSDGECTEGTYALDLTADEARWFIDPRTVPAEPEDPRVAVVAQALSDTLDDNGVTTCDWTAEARDILARIDAARADQ